MALSLRPAPAAPLDDPWRPFTPSEKAGLIVEIMTCYVQARRWLRSMTIEEVAAAARAENRQKLEGPPPMDSMRLAYRLGRLVERGLDRLPGDTRCLTRSLVLLRLLARRGIPATMVIGVHTEPGFRAHAWIECGGHPMLSPTDFADGRLLEI